VKIALVTSRFPQVSETFIARQARLLDADIICEVPTYSLPENYYGPFRIFYLSGRLARLRARIGTLLPAAATATYRRSVAAPATQERKFRWDVESEAGWRQYLEKHRPDVVLAHFGPTALAALGACRDCRIPLVAHFHGHDASSMMRSSTYREQLSELFQHAAGVVCVSSCMAGVLRVAGCPEGKLQVIPCGVPLKEFGPSATVTRQPCRFLAVSRLIPGKGPLVTLEAFRMIHERRPETRLTLAGGGPLLEAARRFTRENALQESVSLAGPLHISEVQRLFQESSVFVQASLTDETGWVEGWGVSVAEGLATGLPAVVTRSGGMTDMVRDGFNGFLFEEGDSRGMADAMLRLADEPDLRLLMGRRGRALIEEAGSTERNVERLAAALQSACGAAVTR
jgi:glycosyltransferase involved in cell wall biosynthesis